MQRTNFVCTQWAYATLRRYSSFTSRIVCELCTASVPQKCFGEAWCYI